MARTPSFILLVFLAITIALTTALPPPPPGYGASFQHAINFFVLSQKNKQSVIPVPHAKGKGLNFDSCTKNDDCEGIRECNSIFSVGVCLPFKVCTKTEDCESGQTCLPSEGLSNKICSPIDISSFVCTESEQCDTGEICAKIDDDKLCASKAQAERAGWNEACIGVHHLDEQAVVQEDRVFVTDYRAWVLCDSRESCATPGHMVVWKGDAMMMKSYCEIVGCERKAMRVNSPKYSRRARIGSRSEGLEFTAFAGKWMTETEERVLRGLVRMGL